ncbi:hypothetical protein Clacol_005580 [Clathrus columnatus]|uniref:Fungal-type protein kinase domain-containing protein n=1 Tax=Clathrus columnatus TaxID=1419009 RepID=A0AAV5AE03_9AGAM|nr:hypothetical protein Clacol_005580 [Clathrus columnatus]
MRIALCGRGQDAIGRKGLGASAPLVLRKECTSFFGTPPKTSARSGTSKLITSEERSHIPIPDIEENFVTTYLISLASLSGSVVQIKSDLSIKQSLLQLEQKLDEKKLYEPLGNIFNKVASSVCDVEPIVFHPSYSIGPSEEIRQEDRHLLPDFSILPQKKFTFTHKDKKGNIRIPWSTLESTVEVKKGRRWDRSQAIDYIETLLQYRPDKVYALGMSCNQQSYQFYYADACIQKSSPIFHWKNGLDAFIQFVHTLHQLYKEDTGRDKSYTLHNVIWQQKGILASPRWRVSFNEKTNEVQRMLARRGTGRRTWIGIGREIEESSTVVNTSEKDRIRVVKDIWRDTSRRFKENQILTQIHEDGYVAGVTRHIHISAGTVDELSVGDINGNRVKERVVMGSTGLRLSACESVLEFLKVMYDLVETHEQLVVKRRVLHRDISWYNVLCQAEHFIGDDNVTDPPTIGKLLRKEGKEREPLCLLTDFDNASLMTDNNAVVAAQRTGTPMFIACELSYGSLADNLMRAANVVFTPNQFSLEGKALEAYLEIYGQERYNDYEFWLQSIVSKSEKTKLDSATNEIGLHRPIHDMESVYWLILWFIIKALPTGVNLELERDNHHFLEGLMLSRRIGLTGQAFSIVPFLRSTEENWKGLLNPVYEPLVGMLFNMSQYICMRWLEFPEVIPWHPHEAFKRLLLKEIIRMTDGNCPIPIKGPRPPSKKVSDKLSGTSSSQVLSQPGPSIPELQPAGSQKRPHSESPDHSRPFKKPRTEILVEDHSNSFEKFVENIASDTLWFL